jgi:hypothetical protein
MGSIAGLRVVLPPHLWMAHQDFSETKGPRLPLGHAILCGTMAVCLMVAYDGSLPSHWKERQCAHEFISIPGLLPAAAMITVRRCSNVSLRLWILHWAMWLLGPVRNFD